MNVKQSKATKIQNVSLKPLSIQLFIEVTPKTNEKKKQLMNYNHDFREFLQVCQAVWSCKWSWGTEPQKGHDGGGGGVGGAPISGWLKLLCRNLVWQKCPPWDSVVTLTFFLVSVEQFIELDFEHSKSALYRRHYPDAELIPKCVNLEHWCRKVNSGSWVKKKKITSRSWHSFLQILR